MTSEPTQFPVRPRRRRAIEPTMTAEAAREVMAPPPPAAQPPRTNGSGAVGDRLAPQALEAEQAVLGAILIDNAAFDAVAPLLSPSAFYRLAHGEIWTAMASLHRSGTAIDMVTVTDELRRLQRIEAIGGPAYLAQLMSATPTAVHAEAYARRVAAAALARAAISGAGRIAAIGYEEPNDPLLLLDRLRTVVDEITGAWSAPAGQPQRLGARELTLIPREPPPPMLLGRLDPTGHTVLYGTGGTGKGVMAAHWSLELAKLGHRVLIVDYENHPDEWARRVYGLGGAELLDRILHVAPLTAAWGGKRGAIWEQMADLRALAGTWGATYQIIDSTITACLGADALKPEAAAQYAGALEYIGLPTLSVTHVTKDDDLRYPFGSVFWHNLARTTWSAKRDGAAMLLAHRKHNNYERVGTTQVEVTWSDGLPVSIWEREHSEALTQRVSKVLAGSPGMTVTEICDALDEDAEEDADATKPDSVRRVLNRGAKARPPSFVKDGQKWRDA